jgi:N-hydroxyarylamine O-acetyltransferase
VKLSDYFRRIGYNGKTVPTAECLTAIHRAHALHVPYENLDVQLGRRLDFDLARIFDKFVTRNRGGWCYEAHALLDWALREIGFDAMQVAAGIHRDQCGDACVGDHTAVLVRIDGRTWLADLGLGDGIRDPIPLIKGLFVQGPLTFKLEPVDDGYWRFHNHAFAFPNSFDFRDEPADWKRVESHNQRQQSDPSATLVANLVCQIMKPDAVTCLTGRVLREKTVNGTTKRLLSEDEFEPILSDVFNIHDNDLASLWPKVATRHALLFGEKTAEQIDFRGF